jgi:hypothetical protein
MIEFAIKVFVALLGLGIIIMGLKVIYFIFFGKTNGKNIIDDIYDNTKK